MAIYNVATYVERNPLYGGIYIWVIFAIRNNVETYKSQYTDLLLHSTFIAMIQCVSIGAFSAYLAAEYITSWEFENWKSGLLYSITDPATYFQGLTTTE